MTTKRFLLGAVAAAWAAGSGWGQSPTLPESVFAPVQGEVLPGGVADGPERKPMPPPPVPDAPTATSVLTGAPPGHPPGTVTSPWCGPGGTGCCGPVGGNGLLTYELYTYNGVSLPVAGGGFSGRLRTGWETGAGARSLYFNNPGTAAWFLDLGLTYTYNRGKQDRQLQVFTPQPRDAAGNLMGPDMLNVFVVRGLHRTNFNFSVGRDWWVRGPGYVTGDCGVNWRFGGDLGGRWGTSHVDLVPVDDRANYLRRQGVTQSIFFGVHLDREKNFGAWTLFGGARAEYDYTWTNVIPDHNGDLVSINLLFHLGIRY